MCLTLERIQDPMIAEEDIVCYKVLELYPVHSLVNGKAFTANINGRKVTGRVGGANIVFLCHNDPGCSGISIHNKLGYLYSWCYDNCVDQFKLVDDDNTDNYMIYQTPYRQMTIKIGETYIGELDEGCLQVNCGFHSYADTMGALRSAKKINGIVVKCIIPKGSKYHEGSFNWDRSYASNVLTYVELINE